MPEIEIRVCPEGRCKNILREVVALPIPGKKNNTNIDNYAYCSDHGMIRLIKRKGIKGNTFDDKNYTSPLK